MSKKVINLILLVLVFIALLLVMHIGLRHPKVETPYRTDKPKSQDEPQKNIDPHDYAFKSTDFKREPSKFKEGEIVRIKKDSQEVFWYSLPPVSHKVIDPQTKQYIFGKDSYKYQYQNDYGAPCNLMSGSHAAKYKVLKTVNLVDFQKDDGAKGYLVQMHIYFGETLNWYYLEAVDPRKDDFCLAGYINEDFLKENPSVPIAMLYKNSF